MQDMKLNIPQYPMLKLVVCYGNWMIGVASVMGFTAGIEIFAALGTLASIFLGIVVSVLVFVVTRVLVELVRLITDMLLPQ